LMALRLGLVNAGVCVEERGALRSISQVNRCWSVIDAILMFGVLTHEV